MSARRLVIATRRSRLALWQAEHIKARLEKAHAGLAVELLPMSTRGDELLDQRLDDVGGKGLFVKELENAMLDGRADIAVHSMKDVPADLPAGFTLAAISAREDPRDAFVSRTYSSLGEMPAGSVIGTSSLRRSTQVAARYPASLGGGESAGAGPGRARYRMPGVQARRGGADDPARGSRHRALRPRRARREPGPRGQLHLAARGLRRALRFGAPPAGAGRLGGRQAHRARGTEGHGPGSAGRRGGGGSARPWCSGDPGVA